jgi:hypothetical protein
MKLKPCPYCESETLEHKYVYVECMKCGMHGPKSAERNDDHADYMDMERASETWNALPRKVDAKG